MQQSKQPNSPGGGGYLVYLSDGDVAFLRVSFSPIFSRTGYQKKAIFLQPVVKTCQKRNFVTLDFRLLEYTFYQLLLESGII